MRKCDTLIAAIKLVLWFLLCCALLLVPSARAEPASDSKPVSPAQPPASAPSASQPADSAKKAAPKVSKLGKIELAPTVSYEQQRLDRQLTKQKLTEDLLPAGKRIGFVRIVRDDVFVADEIWPLWFNWFHGLTREDVVRRELLFQKGERYDEARVEETMRNLRGMGIFALVRIVAVKGERPDEVGILVSTRDLWSLRLETNFNITKRVINSLVVRLNEINAFGRNKQAGVEVSVGPTSYLVGESFYARRVFGSSLALKERAGLIFNRMWGGREGEIASVSLGQPFYRLAQRFAWSANYSHDDRVYRNTGNGVIRRYPSRFAPLPHALQVYQARVEDAYLVASYRTGEAFKHTLSAGWDFRYRDAKPTWETNLPDSLREDFIRDVLPLGRTDHGPTASYEMFVPHWATFVNLASYGQSENVRTGPALSLGTRVPLRVLGSTANAWVVSATAGWVLAPRGYLVDLRVSGLGRLQQGAWLDQKATFQVRGATPVFSIFRFVTRAYLELRRNDTLRTYVTLGADNGLRGYLSQQIGAVGAHRMLANFELRTLPIMWQAVHLGGVLFYDVGSVFYNTSNLTAFHSVGIGLRLLFPQFNRQPFSFDGGASFYPTAQFVPTFAAGQVVPLTAVEDLD
jgi:hypothetical protein